MMRWGETDCRVAALLAMTEHGSRKIHPQQIPAPPLPILLGAIVTQLYNVTDSIIVGQFVSADALAVARQNIADTGARVTLCQGDLFAAAAGERFDIIVSNPPYITAEEMADLQPEVCREPALALYGGSDGLDFYRRIAREAPDYLLPGGWLLLEIGSAQAEAVSALLAERFEALAVYPDMQGLPRAVAGRLRECARV